MRFMLIFLLLLPLITFGHEGHGEGDGYTITHYFTSPVHLAVLAVALLLTALLLVTRRQYRRNKR